MKRLYEVQYQDMHNVWQKSGNGKPGENPFTSLTKAKKFAERQHKDTIRLCLPVLLTYRVVWVEPRPVMAVYGKVR